MLDDRIVLITGASRGIGAATAQLLAASTPLRRNGEPADVAGAVLMFLQDESRFITGAYVDVDGGARIGQSGADISVVNRSQVPATARQVGA